MKLFRRKEKLYGEIVKYSHKTALENPDMIDREYEHKITNLEKKIREHKENKKYFSFQVTWKDKERSYFEPQKYLNIAYRKDMYLYPFPIHHYEGEIHFDKKGIMKFVNVEPAALLEAVNHNDGLDAKIIKLKLELEDLRKERTKFRKNYLKTKYKLEKAYLI